MPDDHSLGTMFVSVMIGVRVMYALVSSVADCDEVFNYWEPAHQLMYGKGLQTWEYSPDYGLRSYLYLYVNMWSGVMVQNVLTRSSVFMVMRGGLVVLSGYIDSAFVNACSEAFGRRVGWLLGGLLVFSTGSTMASFCFLPSSFTLMCLTSAISNQLYFKSSSLAPVFYAIFFAVISVVLGWPFVGFIAVPMGLHALTVYGLVRPLVVGILVTGTLGVLVYQTDSTFYGRPVFSTWELVKYNVLGCLPYADTKDLSVDPSNLLQRLGCFKDETGSRGAHLYGVEGPEFFFKNLFLNFNVAFLAALLCPVALLLRRVVVGPSEKVWLKVTCVSPFFLWFVFWLFIPHKEERFMVPIYSTLCLTAAVTLDAVIDVTDQLVGKRTGKGTWPATAMGIAVWLVVAVVFIVLSISRSSALTTYYSAPLSIMYEVSVLQGGSGEVLCMGRDWYRFMSHFFVPEFLVVAFVNDGFAGLLPKYFTSTTTAPPGFNDLNQMDPNQFVSPDTCTYLVATSFPSDTAPSYNPDEWTMMSETPLLDVQSTSTLHRAFMLPSYVPGDAVYGKMMLLKRN
eukprot:TRINITY_DN8226_c0_g1_i1.p1 TRINITY_DN8226_c0_g1~~TRINITY_DN8226_c0_g1_i1.p1  ORF type:complete len:566 (+),score=139.24 TRINITY_DN8226_c0_g1_i1:948-2645(+)